MSYLQPECHILDLCELVGSVLLSLTFDFFPEAGVVLRKANHVQKLTKTSINTRIMSYLQPGCHILDLCELVGSVLLSLTFVLFPEIGVVSRKVNHVQKLTKTMSIKTFDRYRDYLEQDNDQFDYELLSRENDLPNQPEYNLDWKQVHPTLFDRLTTPKGIRRNYIRRSFQRIVETLLPYKRGRKMKNTNE